MNDATLDSGLQLAAADAAMALPPTPGIGGGDILSLGISLFVIIAAILVLGWLYSRSRFVGGGSADLITIIASRALGPKERLLVVEVADKQLLVGMTASNVQTLHVFDSPVQVAPASGNTVGFASRLRNALTERSR